MTSRERLVAAARGGEVDRKPVLRWPCPKGGEADAVVVQEPQSLETEKALLVEVYNPFGLALWRGIDLNHALRDNPEEGNRLLDEVIAEVRRRIQKALDGGADGILYVLYGARAKHCSPMQYGGYYLERDREILSDFGDARLNVLYVVGDDDVYIDFVSDLPAHVFAWDSRSSGFTSQQVREMRPGAQASADPESEILLACETASIARMLEKEDLAAL